MEWMGEERNILKKPNREEVEKITGKLKNNKKNGVTAENIKNAADFLKYKYTNLYWKSEDKKR